MRREIKFRVWNKADQKMSSKVNLMMDMTGVLFWQFAFNAPEPVKRDEYEVMQYTGLKDKDGVEIYEGDVIKGIAADKQTISKGEVSFQGCDYIVNFVEGNARGFYYLHHILLDSVEVIGNIYENPEFLSSSKE